MNEDEAFFTDLAVGAVVVATIGFGLPDVRMLCSHERSRIEAKKLKSPSALRVAMARCVLPWRKMIGATEGLADRADGKVRRLSFGDWQDYLTSSSSLIGFAFKSGCAMPSRIP